MPTIDHEPLAATPCLQNPRMGSASGCISTGQGAARHPIASISALTAVLIWGANLGYGPRRLEGWVSTEAVSRLAGRRKFNTAPELLLPQAVHATGGMFWLHRLLAKGRTPGTSSGRRRGRMLLAWMSEHRREPLWTERSAELRNGVGRECSRRGAPRIFVISMLDTVDADATHATTPSPSVSSQRSDQSPCARP